jgi:hypothetical protein
VGSLIHRTPDRADDWAAGVHLIELRRLDLRLVLLIERNKVEDAEAPAVAGEWSL